MRRKVDGYLAEARNTLAALELDMKQRLAEEKATREREREPVPAALMPDPSAGPTAPVAAAAPRVDPVVPPAPITADSSRPPPLYKRWWFWTAIGGGVAAAAIITGVVLATSNKGYPTVPSGVPRVTLMF